MHVCRLLFRTTSIYQVVCLRLVTTPFSITISSHIHECIFFTLYKRVLLPTEERLGVGDVFVAGLF